MMTVLRNLVSVTGEKMIDAAATTGRFGLFVAGLFRELPGGLRYGRLFFQQVNFIGLGSIPLITLTSTFVGGVYTLQTSSRFGTEIPPLYISAILARSVFLELGPVLTALVVGARVSASFAAEIGTMRVTEQVDALETLAIRPVRFLVVPRFLASMVMFPIMTIYADAIAILGGLLVAVGRVGLSLSTFNRGLRLLFDANDVYGGLIKAVFFGAMVAVAGCFYGFQASAGAEGVGNAATRAVVASCVTVLVLDYFLAEAIIRLLFLHT